MRYLPHTESDIRLMLDAIGKKDLDDLFAEIPKTCRRDKALHLPGPLSEWELNDHMDGLAKEMGSSSDADAEWFLGAGRYDHHIPAIIPYLLSRSEFMTAYTPYQPEISQGTLQAIYEYQTLAARLLGMDIANASHYDGASALAEAILMAVRITRRKTVAVSQLIHPHFRRVVQTYLKPTDITLVELPYTDQGQTDLSKIDTIHDLAAIAVQSPNFFGCIERIETIADTAHAKSGLMVTCFTEALAYGLLKPPGNLGADIACGEGQSLGIPKSFGGPGLGMLACRQKYVRNMPGRLVGVTRDLGGKRGYVLTLATREQHIRREKATSNICTNASLCALAATIFMASLGETGFRKLARTNVDKASYLKQGLKNCGCRIPFSAPTFNEFVVRYSEGKEKEETSTGRPRRQTSGLRLDTYYPKLRDHYLLCATETLSRPSMDRFIQNVTATHGESS